MKSIKVYGSGCAKCEVLYSSIEKILTEGHVMAHLSKVEDYGEMALSGILSTPALVIDGQKVSEGRVPSEKEIRGFLGV
jgi:small redox-active disulfide protein 2